MRSYPVLAGAVLLALVLVPTRGAIAQEPTGTLVVVNKGPGTVSIVDVASGTLLARLPTGEGPHEVAITSDGRMAVVTDYGARSGGNTLTVVDVPGLRVARTIDLGRHRRPHGIAVLPGDELVAVTSEESNHVVLVGIADGRIVSEIPTGHPGSHVLAMVADGSTIFTSNMGDNTVSALDVGAADHTGTVPVPARPEAIGVTADGTEVWVGSNDAGTISAIDAASGDAEQVLDGFHWPYRILFTPDKERVLIPDLGRHLLMIVERESRGVLHEIELRGAGPQGITLAPDARTAFLSLSQEGRVVVIDLDRGEVVRSIDAGERPDGVVFTERVVRRPPGADDR